MGIRRNPPEPSLDFLENSLEAKMKKVFALVLAGALAGFAGCGDDNGGGVRTSGNLNVVPDNIDKGNLPNVKVNDDCPANFAPFCKDGKRVICDQGKIDEIDCADQGGCVKIIGHSEVRCANNLGRPECNKSGQWWTECGVDADENYLAQKRRECRAASNDKAYLYDDSASKMACAGECRSDGTCKVEVCDSKYVISCSENNDATLWCNNGYVTRTICTDGKVCKFASGGYSCQ